MALINGNNESGKLFDVLDVDGDVLGSFDEMSDAIRCGRAAPWYAVWANIRRDVAIHARSHMCNQEVLQSNRALFDCAA